MILAVAVLESHTSRLFFPSAMIPGGYAVETFFMISGFYIALILSEKYFKKQNSYALFITNRILRLYPLYFIILLMNLVIYAVCYSSDNPLAAYVHADWLPLLWMVFSNLFIVGLDVPYFLTHIQFPDALVGQAWSLSLEFMFYLIAPLLLRLRKSYLIALLVMSLGLRVCLISNGLYKDPWSFRFFPTELAFFLLGIFSYKIYAAIKDYRIPKTILLASLFVPVVLTVFWYSGFKFLQGIIPLVSLPIPYPSYLILYYFLIWITLPFIFLLTKDNPFDRWIGEFSYPIYLIHLPVVYLFNIFKINSVFNQSYGWEVLLVSGILSLLLLYLVIYPIERIREHRVLSHKI